MNEKCVNYTRSFISTKQCKASELQKISLKITFFFQNATVIVKYSWGVFRALSQMIALSYGSMDAPTSENYRLSISNTNKAQLYHILAQL